MFEYYHNKQNGFVLLVVLIVIAIIAAIFFGSSYSSRKSQVNTYLEVDKKAEKMIDNINLNTKKQQKEIKKLEN